MHDSPDNLNSQSADNAPAEEIDDISQLRERLAFYESFDRLIQDNISRAGELLREAASRKSETELALRSNTVAIEQAQMAERINYRRVFSGLLDQITTVQQNVERLAREVSDALDDLESVIPAAGEITALENDTFPTMPTFSTGLGGSLGTGLLASPDWLSDDEVSNPVSAGGFDEESGAELVAESPDDQVDHGVIEPIDEFATVDEATELEDETDFGIGALRTGSDFSSVVQASVDRVSQTYGSTELESDDLHADIDRDQLAEDVAQAESADDFDDLPFDVEPEEPYAEETTVSSIDSVAEDIEAPGSDDFLLEDNEVVIAIEIQDNEGGLVAAGPGDDERELTSEEWQETGIPAVTTLLVHNVPRATTALSLKRYLEALDQVHSVEPREYAEGVLRLQVSSDRPVALDDLRGWPEAAGLESISESTEFVEVKLAQ